MRGGCSKLAYMEQDHKHFQHAFSFEKGGYGPGINWYRAVLRNINEEDEKSMYHFPLYPVSPILSHLKSLRLKLVLYHLTISRILLICNAEIPTPAHTLTHPTLLIASTGYFITVTINFAEQMRPLVPNLKVENVDGGHWLQLEKADEVNKILEEFMEEKRLTSV